MARDNRQTVSVTDQLDAFIARMAKKNRIPKQTMYYIFLADHAESLGFDEDEELEATLSAKQSK
ncbi:MAG: hypothetical protein ACXWAT_06715 [Methylobacter sp.]